MSLAEDLIRLEQLHARGALNDEEYARAKSKLINSPSAVPNEPALSALNAFRRSATDRWFGGLCGGLAVTTGMQSWLWRLMFVLLFMVAGSGLIVYLVMWFFVPLDTSRLLAQAPSGQYN